MLCDKQAASSFDCNNANCSWQWGCYQPALNSQPPLPGFSHSAFTFGHESNVLRIQLDPNTVPPGTLVTFVQKGLQYVEMEANIDGVSLTCVLYVYMLSFDTWSQHSDPGCILLVCWLSRLVITQVQSLKYATVFNLMHVIGEAPPQSLQFASSAQVMFVSVKSTYILRSLVTHPFAQATRSCRHLTRSGFRSNLGA